VDGLRFQYSETGGAGIVTAVGEKADPSQTTPSSQERSPGITACAQADRFHQEVGGEEVGVVWFGSMADDGNKGGKKNGTLGDLVKAESMIQLALMLPAGCVIGALAGVALDKHFHTGWIVVVGILLGAVAGFIQIYRTAAHYMKKDN
jgi:hypothetical protein